MYPLIIDTRSPPPASRLRLLVGHTPSRGGSLASGACARACARGRLALQSVAGWGRRPGGRLGKQLNSAESARESDRRASGKREGKGDQGGWRGTRWARRVDADPSDARWWPAWRPLVGHSASDCERENSNFLSGQRRPSAETPRRRRTTHSWCLMWVYIEQRHAHPSFDRRPRLFHLLFALLRRLFHSRTKSQTHHAPVSPHTLTCPSRIRALATSSSSSSCPRDESR